MTNIELHDKAMELAEQADLFKRANENSKALSYYEEAFYLEREAALCFKDEHDYEPTRSILFKSAAYLAIECSKNRDAEQMISYALAGNPPNGIADELRDLLENINFRMHLSTRGLELSDEEMQVSIWGKDVSFGLARSREVVERIEKLETLAYRTQERLMNRTFRKSGRPEKAITDIFDVYVSVPRAASFAITIRLAGRYAELPGLSSGHSVLKEILDCFEIINKGNNDDLKKRIANEDYYINFVSISKHIAPDGKRVEGVGLTLIDEGKERELRIIRKRPDWIQPLNGGIDSDNIFDSFKGRLLAADATKMEHGEIYLVDGDKASKPIHVKLAMMADIVRPLFNLYVKADVQLENNKYWLLGITPWEEETI